MPFVLGTKSRKTLQGVHPDLVRVVERAIQITEVDFTVLEGRRTLDRQKQLLASGASTTMNSRHLVAPNGYAHAVDLGALLNGRLNWSWPLYHKVAKAMKQAAAELAIPLVWGGDWKSFKDGPHFELRWKEYPGKKG